jgi:hypothetical protein
MSGVFLSETSRVRVTRPLSYIYDILVSSLVLKYWSPTSLLFN